MRALHSDKSITLYLKYLHCKNNLSCTFSEEPSFSSHHKMYKKMSSVHGFSLLTVKEFTVLVSLQQCIMQE